MGAYIVRRLMQGALAILLVFIVVFLVTHAIGNPIDLMLPAEATEEMRAAMAHRLGLDMPLYVQFFDFLKDALTLDFGNSIWQGVPCLPLVLGRLPRTMFLAIVTMGWAFIAGTTLATLSAIKPYAIGDKALSFITLLAASTIPFWVGLMLILVVAVFLGWLPTSGFGGFLDLRYLILPSLALGLRPCGRIAQTARPAIIEELNSPYVTALRAKGLGEVRVFYHLLRGVATVIVTMTGYEFIGILCGGGVIVETVFAWPGLGQLSVMAIENRDWPLIVTAVTLSATMVVIFHILLDILYAKLKPQVRFE